MTWQQQCLSKQVAQTQSSHPLLSKVTINFKQKGIWMGVCDYYSDVH